MEHFALERYSQSTRTNEEDASAFGLNLPDIFELKTSSDKKKEILKTIQSFKAAYDYKSFEEYLKFNYQEPEAIEAWKACIQGTNLRLYAESTGEKHSYIVTAGWGDQFSKSLKDITWYVSEIAEVHTDGYTNSKFGRDSLLGDVSIHISRKKDEFGPIVLKIGGNVDGQSVSERKYVIPPEPKPILARPPYINRIFRDKDHPFVPGEIYVSEVHIQDEEVDGRVFITFYGNYEYVRGGEVRILDGSMYVRDVELDKKIKVLKIQEKVGVDKKLEAILCRGRKYEVGGGFSFDQRSNGEGFLTILYVNDMNTYGKDPQVGCGQPDANIEEGAPTVSN